MQGQSPTPSFDDSFEQADALPTASPPDAEPIIEDELTTGDAPEPETGESAVEYRASGNDPIFGYLIAMALCIGLTPLIPASADARLVLSWSILAFFGVLAWLLGSTSRIGEEQPENLIWGVVFGLIVAAPLFLIGGDTLQTTVQLIFQTGINSTVAMLPRGVILALLVFVMPLGETLFFRGIMQINRPFLLVGLLASIWSMALFFPSLDVGRFPAVGVLVGTAMLMINMVYSYVRQRNGLAAAWLCQITVNLVLLYLPVLSL
ncbi:MAG: hypothetical protein SF162_16055 [bacterium]|nr:hypothetical protein [bacterium]